LACLLLLLLRYTVNYSLAQCPNARKLRNGENLLVSIKKENGANSDFRGELKIGLHSSFELDFARFIFSVSLFGSFFSWGRQTERYS
jgi:hypothetical protein